MARTPDVPISRRSALAVGGGAALGAGLLGALPAAAPDAASACLPVEDMQEILQTDDMLSSGVLEVDISRSDPNVTGPDGARFDDGFQIQHEFYVQSLGRAARS